MIKGCFTLTTERIRNVKNRSISCLFMPVYSCMSRHEIERFGSVSDQFRRQCETALSVKYVYLDFVAKLLNYPK